MAVWWPVQKWDTGPKPVGSGTSWIFLSSSKRIGSISWEAKNWMGQREWNSLASQEALLYVRDVGQPAVLLSGCTCSMDTQRTSFSSSVNQAPFASTKVFLIKHRETGSPQFLHFKDLGLVGIRIRILVPALHYITQAKTTDLAGDHRFKREGLPQVT